MMLDALDVLTVALSAAVLAMVVALTVRILQKAGLSGWWCIPSLIPVLNVMLIWVFAWADWPKMRREENPQP